MRETLRATTVGGIATNLPLLQAIVGDAAYAAGDTTTRFLEERAHLFALGNVAVSDDAKRRVAAAILARGDDWRLAGVGIPLAFVVEGTAVYTEATVSRSGWKLSGEIDGEIAADANGATYDTNGGTVTVDGTLVRWAYPPPPSADAEHAAHAATSGDVTAPMPGKIVSVAVTPGATVEPHALLIVLEAMKMEHRIEAQIGGTVREVRVQPGELVTGGAMLVTIGPA
jgi:propionyl-CoA carboxylase alpha chain